MHIQPPSERPPRARTFTVSLALLAALAACGQQAPTGPHSGAPSPHASTGQVGAVTAARVSRYAAARFADQVSFGATPALVAEIERMGLSAWIDAQFALPVSQIDTTPIRYYDSQVFAQTEKGYKYAIEQLYASLLASPDQLRRRVSWSLSQYITTSMAKIEPYGALAWSNFLQRHAFGNYGELIRATSTNASMGVYLDNVANRPISTGCPRCSPNENYARELMQLFTLGVVKLQPDGTPERDSANRPAETYTQRDVEELARVLTGWNLNAAHDRMDYSRYDRVMVPDPWPSAHDYGAKTVLGKSFPAGVDAPRELDAAVALLMGHQNIAPFVSLRLIQHLVTSNPSPAYVARVAAAFRNNGTGGGDMKAVVKAILLDPEARQGDLPGLGAASFGKLREPVLWYTGLLRGMGCQRTLSWEQDVRGWPIGPVIQRPFDAASVFSYYLPSDRAPGSNLLAPEQRLLNAHELGFRLGALGRPMARPESGCDSAAFARALASSPSAFADLVGERYFRGALPPLLRRDLIELAAMAPGAAPLDQAITLLQYALASPYYGVIR